MYRLKNKNRSLHQMVRGMEKDSIITFHTIENHWDIMVKDGGTIDLSMKGSHTIT